MLVGSHDEDRAHRGGVVGRAAIGQIGLCRQHVEGLGDREVGIGDDRKGRLGAACSLDVLFPALVLFHAVDGHADDLDAALVPLVLERRDATELGGADRGEVLRMRKDDRPAVTDEIVQGKRALIGLDIQVRNWVVDAQGHGSLRW